MFYVLIECEDVEITGVWIFDNEARARAEFERRAEPLYATLCDAEMLSREIEGTLGLAGDDAYSVQLVQRTLGAC
jgi:hypothetical protein